ncbi:hypothetical protein EW145_g6243 [Phellinidium pouzarii]|uniref:T6SS Phospholipase effector Tle1-like catalytic domain-containing protein n=1 Tax=Phellinidium pouzarii TaxID=167371 RepID=A0A4S4KX78_9AGAM|nr:hypothetical protein EW145_g6243 [Phellinidium pouzarii]
MSDSYSAATTPTVSGFSSQGHKSASHSPRVATQTSLDTTYAGEVIPPYTDRRTLVLCFDGTGDQFDSDNSNVVQFFAMLKKGDKDQQLVYYQAGIGTYTIPQIATPFYAKLSKTLDAMIAIDLNHHVMGGYEFLMENYKEGDKICIFGFSRGAYTARALAGMIHKVGLLPNGNHQQVPFAYRMYMKDDAKGWEQSVLFKKTFSMDVDIEFVGVWDTVASVGLIPRRLPFTKSNTAIKTFRHALSLDEHRAKFKANNYQVLTDEEAARADFAPQRENKAKHEHNHVQHDSKAILEDIVDAAKNGSDAIKRVGSSNSGKHDEIEGEGRKRRLELMYTDRSRPTDVLEVWFAGCHCDIGGGSVPNDMRHSLARLPLRWMIRQCFLTNTGIQFQADKLRDIAGIDPTTLYPKVHPRPPPLAIPNPPPITPMDPPKGKAAASAAAEEFSGEEEEELRDALCPIYDQLKLAPPWWILELLPMREHVQKEDGTWTKTIGLNLARPRVLPHQTKNGIRVHRSVKMRMEVQELEYKPRLRFEVDPIWED